jgi:hypothetical protein
MTPRGNDEWKTFLGGGEGNPFFLGINRRWFEHIAKRLRMRKYPFKPAEGSYAKLSNSSDPM